MRRMSLIALISLMPCLGITGCIGGSTTSEDPGANSLNRRNTQLGALKTDTVQLAKEKDGSASQPLPHTIRVWLALNSSEQEEGLMYVPASAIADDQGMLFRFDTELVRGFWMRNTITPLDIAFARRNGEIVAIHTMPPLTLNTFSSFEPAMFALEVKAGTFEKLGIIEGDTLVVPDSVLKATP